MRGSIITSAGGVLSAALTGGVLGAAGGCVYGILWGALLGLLVGEPAKTLWCAVYFAVIVAGSGAVVGGLGRFLLGAEEGGTELSPAGERGAVKKRVPLRPETVARDNGGTVPLPR
jgi:hypothetical protein